MDGVRSTVFLLSSLFLIFFGRPNYISGRVTLLLAVTGASRITLRGLYRQSRKGNLKRGRMKDKRTRRKNDGKMHENFKNDKGQEVYFLFLGTSLHPEPNNQASLFRFK